MNDGIMYVWNVMEHEPYQGGVVIFTCARQETAEYLRDWCEAEECNRLKKTIDFLSTRMSSSELRGTSMSMQRGLDTYSVTESEVIL